MTNIKRADNQKRIYSAWKKDSLNNYGFFVIFTGFLERNYLKKISGGALKLYIFMGIKSQNNTGESFFTIQQMSKYFEVSTRSISNWIKELEKNSLITRIQLKYNGVSHTFLNTYVAGEKTRNKNNKTND